MVSALEFDSRWKSVFPALSSSLTPESSYNKFLIMIILCHATLVTELL